MPISSENFAACHANTTPTIVLIDGAGVVRFYHPGAVSEAELAAQLQAVLRKGSNAPNPGSSLR